MAFFDLVRLVHASDHGKLESLLSPEAAREVDVDDRTLLMYAVLAEKTAPSMVELLVRHGTPIDACDREGWTALHFAARDQREALVRELLRLGAAIDPRNNLQNTPLNLCISSTVEPKPGVVAALIEHGADPNAKNAKARAPIDGPRGARMIAAAVAGEADVARPYSAKSTFKVGERVVHPQFGDGPVSKLLPDRKVEIEFSTGTRVLVHNR